MSAFIVVNPHSAAGRTGREWRALERRLAEAYPAMCVAFTRGRGHATALVSGALREGHHEIVAVGGDGTINEAVNGFFDAEGSISPDAVLAVVSSGTGGDFVRGLVSDGKALGAAERLKHAPARAIDVGRVACLSRDGLPRTRYFANMGSFGLSGTIAGAVNRDFLARLVGGRLAFAFHGALGLLAYRGRAVRLIVDARFDEIVPIVTVAIANGTSFGGGMTIAPNAKPEDGLFDVVIIRHTSRKEMLEGLKLVYSGEHLSHPAVRVVRGRKVVAAPVAETQGRAVPVETDGEAIGRLPATFEILPRALNVRC
jgi:YegS/Rv2252/BmrU family lipid kinase